MERDYKDDFSKFQTRRCILKRAANASVGGIHADPSVISDAEEAFDQSLLTLVQVKTATDCLTIAGRIAAPAPFPPTLATDAIALHQLEELLHTVQEAFQAAKRDWASRLPPEGIEVPFVDFDEYPEDTEEISYPKTGSVRLLHCGGEYGTNWVKSAIENDAVEVSNDDL